MSAAATLQRTPLNAWHRARGGQMVEFAGWDMPVAYAGIVEEHLAVRGCAGLFDVSHMGRFTLAGAGAEAFLQGLTTNDVTKLAPGTGHYTLALNDRGTVLDDLIVFRLTATEFLVIMNAGNREKILAHVKSRVPAGVVFTHRSEEWAMVAWQGPQAVAIADRLSPGVIALPRFAIARVRIAGRECWASRTGYTGEDGVEFYPEAGLAPAVCDALLAAGESAGARPCGLGSRDGLRLEVAYPLYGHEITEDTTPWEAGLGWVVRMEKGEFLGRAALAAQKAAGIPRRLAAFTCAGPGVPRQGYGLTLDGAPAGLVTSGTYSPVLKTGIGLGYLPTGAAEGAALALVVRGRGLPAVRVKPPFYKAGSVVSVGSGKTS